MTRVPASRSAGGQRPASRYLIGAKSAGARVCMTAQGVMLPRSGVGVCVRMCICLGGGCLGQGVCILCVHAIYVVFRYSLCFLG